MNNFLPKSKVADNQKENPPNFPSFADFQKSKEEKTQETKPPFSFPKSSQVEEVEEVSLKTEDILESEQEKRKPRRPGRPKKNIIPEKIPEVMEELKEEIESAKKSLGVLKTVDKRFVKDEPEQELDASYAKSLETKYNVLPSYLTGALTPLGQDYIREILQTQKVILETLDKIHISISLAPGFFLGPKPTTIPIVTTNANTGGIASTVEDIPYDIRGKILYTFKKLINPSRPTIKVKDFPRVLQETVGLEFNESIEKELHLLFADRLVKYNDEDLW